MSTEARELSRQDALARRPGRNIEELENAYKDLEAYKKEEEKQKKEAEKDKKSQLAAEKKMMNRALQQAQKQVNSTQKAVNGLLRQLDKVEQDLNKKTGLKALQEAKREELLKKLRDDQHHVEVQLNAKHTEVGESKGKLVCIERALRQLGGEEISVEADVSAGTAISEDPQVEAEIQEQGHLRKLADDIRVRNDELAEENQQLRLEFEDALRTAEGRRAAKEQAAADRREARREQQLQAREARKQASERRRSESRRRKLEDMASALGNRSFDDPSAGVDSTFGAPPPSSMFPAPCQSGFLIASSALIERSRSESRPLSVRSCNGTCTSNGVASPQAHRIAPMQQTSTRRLPARSLTPTRRPTTPMEGAYAPMATSPVRSGNCQRGRSPCGMTHPSTFQKTASAARTSLPMSVPCVVKPLPVWATSFTGGQAQALSARSPSGSPSLGGLSCLSARPVPKVYTAPGPRPADRGYGALGSRTPSRPLLVVNLAAPAPPLGGQPLGTPPMAQLAPWPGAGSATALPAGGGLSVTTNLARPMSFPTLAAPMPRMQSQSPTPARPMPAPQMEPLAHFADPPPGGGWRGGKRGSITDVLFDAIDVDHDGCITRQELRAALRSEIVTAI